MRKTVKVGDHRIGDGHPPFFVAELGICHGGDIAVALELTRAAVNAGAHCVKTETFQKSRLVCDPSATTSYVLDGKKHTVSLAEHMDRYELSLGEHHQIKRLCDTLDVPFMATAHDFAAIDFLADIGAAAVKIASPDIVHYPLLRHAAGARLPVFLDTGAAYQYEIEIAVKTLKESGCEQIVVNHNPTGHPAPADQHNLRIISRLKEIFGFPIGLSDHYKGYEMMYAAVSVGSNTIEKPISMDRFVPEPERNYSISIQDLPKVLENLYACHCALGTPERKMTKDQESYRNNNRVACVAAENMSAGVELNLRNVFFGRPRKGIGVECWDLVEGRKLRRDKKKNEFIRWDDL